MAQENAFTLLSSTRQTLAKPLIPFEKFSRFFGIAAVLELGIEPGAGVTFLSMSTSDDTMNLQPANEMRVHWSPGGRGESPGVWDSPSYDALAPAIRRNAGGWQPWHWGFQPAGGWMSGNPPLGTPQTRHELDLAVGAYDDSPGWRTFSAYAAGDNRQCATAADVPIKPITRITALDGSGTVPS